MMKTIFTDIKLALKLLKREGFMRFFYRLLWYIKGAKLNEDIFEKNKKSLSHNWTINKENLQILKQYPTLSVVIPTYNHESFIEKAITSTQNQDYPSDKLEIIVIDDGSKDKTFEIAKKVLEKGKNPFQLIKQENAGAHATINRGLKLSKSKYLSILNSDDYFHKDRFKILISALENNPNKSEFAFSGVSYINEDGSQMNQDFADGYEKMQKYAIQFPTAGFACLDANIGISTGNFIFTKNLLKKIGDFNEYKFCHDWDFLLRSLEFCEPLFVTEKLYNYRFHGNNSFRGLQEVLPGEVKAILTNFFQINNAINPQFPTEKHFGKNKKNYFKKFIRNHGYKKYLS